MPRLNAIGLKFDTDKSSAHHDFLAAYEKVLSLGIGDVRKLLEVGVHDGNSLRMWAEYFGDATVVGVGSDNKAFEHAADRIVIETADQSDYFSLAKIAMKHGPFQVIVDDGSHIWSHQILTLETLLPFLEEGGVYILEDIDTSFGDYVSTYSRDSTLSAADYIQNVANYLMAGGKLSAPDEESLRVRAIADRLEMIVLVKRSALLLTKTNV